MRLREDRDPSPARLAGTGRGDRDCRDAGAGRLGDRLDLAVPRRESQRDDDDYRGRDDADDSGHDHNRNPSDATSGADPAARVLAGRSLRLDRGASEGQHASERAGDRDSSGAGREPGWSARNQAASEPDPGVLGRVLRSVSHPDSRADRCRGARRERSGRRPRCARRAPRPVARPPSPRSDFIALAATVTNGCCGDAGGGAPDPKGRSVRHVWDPMRCGRCIRSQPDSRACGFGIWCAIAE